MLFLKGDTDLYREKLGTYQPSRDTQREYSLKPLKHSIVKRSLVFKR